MSNCEIYVDLTHDALNAEDIISRVNCPQCGAISVFLGVTRDHHDGHRVVRLEYEAYDSMARTQLTAIGHELAAKFTSVRKVALVHRLGLVPVGEASVVVAVSSPHRRESMEASGFAIDELKTRVAIWKKEVYQDGESQWKANPECPWGPASSQKAPDPVTNS